MKTGFTRLVVGFFMVPCLVNSVAVEIPAHPWQIGNERSVSGSEASTYGINLPDMAVDGWAVLPPECSPRVTVRWEDAGQHDMFVIEGQNYRCVVAMWPFRIWTLQVDGVDLLGEEGAMLNVKDKEGRVYTPARKRAKPDWQVWRGQGLKQAPNANPRFNIWSPGLYYWDAHVLDIPLMRQGSNVPLRGEVVFHAYPDKMHIQVFVTVEPNETAPQRVEWSAQADGGQAATVVGRPAVAWDKGLMLGRAGATVDTQSWADDLSGPQPTTWWIFRPRIKETSPEELFVDELFPLPPEAVTLSDGAWLGYEQASGLYRLIPGFQHNIGFETAYESTGRSLRCGITVANDERPRRMVVKAITDVGILEHSLLTDPHGFMLPVPLQTSKNFGGEREEPDDSPYGDAYFPLQLKAQEQRQFVLHHLFQNWGTHMLKQLSSIRFFNVYWHLSTGVSESTCYTLNWMTPGTREIVHIPDYRPYSGQFWSGQPQHHCYQWPGFLQCNNFHVKLMVDRSVLHSVGPNVSRFTLEGHSSDGGVSTLISSMEVPMDDEMRVFMHLRYDWHQPMRIEGDARQQFRWLNMHLKQTPPDTLVWTDPNGVLRQQALSVEPEPALWGAGLGSDVPVIAAHGQSQKGGDPMHSLVQICSYKARLGGQEQDQVYASAQLHQSNGYWLTTGQKKLTLKHGDFIEADLLLMPYSGHTTPLAVPRLERERWGEDGPRVDRLKAGTLVSHFPTTIKAEDELAVFRLQGGYNWLPVIIEGFEHWKVPLVWLNGSFYNQQVRGGDGYQVERAGDGGYRYTFVAKTKQNKSLSFIVTRAQCSADITRVDDNGGNLELTAAQAGDWQLKTPVFFDTGKHRITAGSEIVVLEAQAQCLRQIPLQAAASKGTADIEVVSFTPKQTELKIVCEHAVTLRFANVTKHQSYELTTLTNGEEQTQQGPGPLLVKVRPGQTRLKVRSL
ncbi:hypothetical protein ACFL6U_29130 [Planctomycetota bacterium]